MILFVFLTTGTPFVLRSALSGKDFAEVVYAALTQPLKFKAPGGPAEFAVTILDTVSLRKSDGNIGCAVRLVGATARPDRNFRQATWALEEALRATISKVRFPAAYQYRDRTVEVMTTIAPDGGEVVESGPIWVKTPLDSAQPIDAAEDLGADDD